MPRTRSTRKRKAQRVLVVANPRAKRRSYVPRMMKTPVVPATKVVRLSYADEFTLNSPASSYAVKEYRANSIFDPDYATGGNQPMGRDQWTVFYDHYQVIASYAKLTCMSAGTGQTNQSYVTLAYEDAPGRTILPFVNQIERNNVKWKHLQTADSDAGSVVLTTSYNPKRTFGVRDLMAAQSRLGAQVGSNPSEQAIFAISQHGMAGAIDPVTITCVIEISYLVRFFERKPIPAS